MTAMANQWRLNTLEYGIGISPNLIAEPQEVASQLSLILGLDELSIYQTAISSTPWQLIARPVSAEVGQQIAELDIFGITIEPISKRFYPQGAVGGQIVGFVIPDDNESTRGAMGFEGYYNEQLVGRVVDRAISNIPFDLPQDIQNEGISGKDIVLTLDRDIQFWVETELLRAITETGSTKGTVIVMNPNNG